MVSLCPTLNHLYFQGSYISLSLLTNLHPGLDIPHIFLSHLLFSSQKWFPTVSTDDFAQDFQMT